MINTETVASDRVIKSLAKGMGIGFGGIVIGRGLGYVTRLAMARLLGTSGFGLISLGLSVLTILTAISTFGMSQGIARFIPYYSQKQQPARVKGAILSGLKIIMPPALLLGLLVFVFSDWMARVIFTEPDLASILRVFGLAIPFSVLSTFLIGGLRGFKRVDYMVFCQEIVRWGTLLLFFFPLYLLGLGSLGAAYAYLFSLVSTALLSLYLLNGVFPLFKREERSVDVSKELLLFSWPLALNALQVSIMGNTETLLLGHFLNPEEVGLYNVALLLATAFPMIVDAAKTIFTPTIAGLYASGASDEIENVLKVLTRWILYVSFPLFLGLLFWPSQAMELFSGAEYASAGAVLRILIFGGLVRCFFTLWGGPTLLAIGKTKELFSLVALAVISNVISGLILIPAWGVSGAAYALVVSWLIQNLIASGLVYRYLQVQPFDRRSFAFMFLTVALFLPLYVVFHVLHICHPGSFLVVTFLTYLTSLTLFGLMGGLGEEEKLVLAALRKRVNLRGACKEDM